MSTARISGSRYILREACSTCHSQQIRPLVAEVQRYGAFSRVGEFVYDRPFLWGSKRTGPDLHRIGGKYSDDWHRMHLINPRAVVRNSIMPAYPWLADRLANQDQDIEKKLRLLQMLGHPYTDEEIASSSSKLEGYTEMDVLIAYLQVLGTAYSGEKS